MQGVEFEQVHVDISDSYKAMYDAAAALWLEVKEAIDSCKETGLIEGPLVKVIISSQRELHTGAVLPQTRQAKNRSRFFHEHGHHLCWRKTPVQLVSPHCAPAVWNLNGASIHSMLANSNPPLVVPGWFVVLP